MHDPLTVAFSIRRPWPERSTFMDGQGVRWDIRRSPFWVLAGRSYYFPRLVTIWHKDPERGGGGDDSCDWFGRRRKLNKAEQAVYDSIWPLEHYLDNEPHWPDSPEHREFQKIKTAIYAWRRRPRVRWHPRWHFHHWRIQIHPWQHLVSWLFFRCHDCKKRLPWGGHSVSHWQDGKRIHSCPKCCGPAQGVNAA